MTFYPPNLIRSLRAFAPSWFKSNSFAVTPFAVTQTGTPMLMQLSKRMLATTDKRLLWKFAYNFGYKGMRSVQRFKKRIKKGDYFPPFLYISIIN